MAETLAQDINSEPLLKHAARETVGSQKCPVIGGVVLVSKLGDGVTGAVFRGQNRNLGRDVAVKLLPYSDDTSERFLRFIAHAKAAKNVKSPRTIEVFDAGDEAGVCYQVVEFFPCLTAEKYLGSLKERLKPGLSESALLDLGIAACDGLAAAHTAGLLHLDLRPSSILIPQQNPDAVQAPGVVGTLDFSEAKLGDLGLAFNEFIARLLDGTNAETGMPGFMSPEQARGEKDIGKSSDVFSMGATLYSLLVGQPPFGGLSVESVLNATVEQPVGDIRTWRPDVSRATAKVVEICLRKDPSQRFADGGVLAQALQISRGAMDGVSDIQQIALKEIEALVKAPAPAEQPTEQTLLLSPAATAELAQSSIELPAMTKSGNFPKPNFVRPEDPALEPTMMAVSSAAIKKAADHDHGSAADMFTDLLKKKVADDDAAPLPVKPLPPPKHEPEDDERTVMVAPPPGASTQEPTMMMAPPPGITAPPSALSTATKSATSSANIPAVEAPAQDEWVDPYKPEPAPKKSNAGLLVAALLLVAVGGVAWQQGWLGAPEKPKRVVMAPPVQVNPNPTDDPAAKSEQERLAAEAKAKQDADAKTKSDAATAEAKAKLEKDLADAKARQEADAKAKLDAEAKLAADAKAKAEAEKAKADIEAAALKAKTEEEAKLAEAKAKKEADERAAAEAKAKADAEAKSAEAALKAKQDDEARRVAEAKAKEEADAKAVADTKAKADAEARVKEQEAARLKTQQEQEEKLLAEAKAKKEADERAATEAKAKADAEAKSKAEAAARIKEQEEEARRTAEAKAKQDAEVKAAEAKTLAEAKAKKEAEERAAETKSKADAEAKALAEAKAKREADSRAETNSKKPVPANLKKEVSVNLGEGVRMDFVLVPGGSFVMGTEPDALSALARKANADEKDYADEIPAHPVDLKPYYIAKTPVTVAQFRRFVTATGYKTSAEKVGAGYVLRDRQWAFTPGASWQKPGFVQRDDHPAVMLSWRDCDAFAAWAAQTAGRKLRIPSEAEWEFAARGPDDYIYPWGNEWSPRLANHADKKLQPHCLPDWSYSQFDDGYAFTSPVGKFINASWCGALDMSGNVFQWCNDLYDRYPEKGHAPQLLLDEVDIPHDAKRVLRGGSYLYHPMGCRSAARRPASQKSASVEFGCRLAMTAE